jgi:Na+-transporting NADH:ubiquinone oxidoreductase subunit B
MRRLVLTHPAPAGPALRRGWTVETVTLIQAAALLLPALAALGLRGPAVLVVGLAGIATALVWETVFARIRHRQITLHGVTTGLILAVMAPADAAVWQIVIAASFGAVIGELAFGGRGFGFLNPGLAALAFLSFSFPGLALAGAEMPVAVAALPGGAVLVWTGLISWRVLVATVLGLVATAGLLGSSPDPSLTGAALIFPLVFLIADPLGAASTNPGRWIYGLLAGVLAALFQTGGAPAPGPEAFVFAALLAGVFAPIIDEIALRALIRIREARHG